HPPPRKIPLHHFFRLQRSLVRRSRNLHPASPPSVHHPAGTTASGVPSASSRLAKKITIPVETPLLVFVPVLEQPFVVAAPSSAKNTSSLLEALIYPSQETS